MMPMARVLRVKCRHPFIQRSLHGGRLAFTQFALGPITVAVLRPLQDIEQLANGLAGNLRGHGEFRTLGHDAPDAATLTVAAFVAQRILRVALDGVVPVAHIHRAARAVA